MGKADGRNFSCLLHGFPSKLGRFSFASAGGQKIPISVKLIWRIIFRMRELKLDSTNTDRQLELAM